MYTSPVTKSRFGSCGFTLIEMLVTLSLVGVIAALAVPNLSEFILNNRLRSTASDLLSSIQRARSEATKRQQTVAVCMSKDPSGAAACDTSGISGWIVFQDSNSDGARATTEAALEAHIFSSSDLNLLADAEKYVSFGATGFVNSGGMQHIVICDKRGTKVVGGLSLARGIDIPATGRARVTRNEVDITNLMKAIGGKCPP